MSSNTSNPKCLPKTEYLLIADVTSKIIKSSENRYELIKLANVIRKSGGYVTIFKSTSM